MSGPYFCAGPSCPGFAYKASELAHPASCAAPYVKGRNTYTKHRLTRAQVGRLAAIANPNGGGAKGGVAAAALERKGLVRTLYAPRPVSLTGNGPEVLVGREPTEAGLRALADARAEGW